MQFDFTQMKPLDRYELLLGAIVPRPIAIVTTISADGTINAAPYSLFNAVSHDPPVVMFSVLPHPEGRLKDTGNNILATKEFVLNLVPESLAEAMNLTCIDAPAGTNELELVKLKTAPSAVVAPPRVADSPVAFECRMLDRVSFGQNQVVIFGQVISAYVADAFVVDASKALIDTVGLNLFGAMHGARWYARTTDRFEMERPTWAGWLAAGKARS